MINIKLIKKKIKSKIPKNIRDFFFTVKKIPKRYPNHKIIKNYLRNKDCLEIGGPSSHFFTHIQIYQNINSLEVVNFSNETVWENKIKPGYTCNYYGNKYALQHILDTNELYKLEKNKYDAVLSNHSLEHMANPIKSLKEWNRVTKKNGFLLLILPNKISNFDHKRPYTTFEHLKSDFINDTQEDDMTHYEEIINLHDLQRQSKEKILLEDFISHSKKNYENRMFHHHVFERNVINKMLEFCGYKVISSLDLYEDLITFCKKIN